MKDIESTQPLSSGPRQEDKNAPFTLVGALFALGLGIWAYFISVKHGDSVNTEECPAGAIIKLVHILFVIEIVQATVLILNLLNIYSSHKITLLEIFSKVIYLISGASSIATWIDATVVCWYLLGNNCGTVPGLYHDVGLLMIAFWSAIALTLFCCCTVMFFALCVGGIALGTVVGGLDNWPQDKHN
jgi:hypothetical protein